MNQIFLKNSKVIFSQPKNFINKPEETIKQLIKYLLDNEIFFSSSSLKKTNIDFNGFFEILNWLDKNGIVFYEKEDFFKMRDETFKQWFWSSPSYYMKLLVLEDFDETVFDIEQTFLKRKVWDSYSKGTIFEWALAFGGKMMLIPKKQKEYKIELVGLLSYKTALTHALKKLESLGIGVHITKSNAETSIGKAYTFDEIENATSYYFLNERGNKNGIFPSIKYKDPTMEYINLFFKLPSFDFEEENDLTYNYKNEDLIEKLSSEIIESKKKLENQQGIELIENALNITTNENKLENILSKKQIANESEIIPKANPQQIEKKEMLISEFNNNTNSLKILNDELNEKYKNVVKNPTVNDIISLKDIHKTTMEKVNDIRNNIQNLKDFDFKFDDSEIEKIKEENTLTDDKIEYIYNSIKHAIQIMSSKPNEDIYIDKIKPLVDNSLNNFLDFDFKSLLKVSIEKITGFESPEKIFEKNKIYGGMFNLIGEGISRIINIKKNLDEYDKYYDDDDFEINKTQIILKSIQNRLSNFYENSKEIHKRATAIESQANENKKIATSYENSKKMQLDTFTIANNKNGLKFENINQIAINYNQEINEKEFVYLLVSTFLKLDIYLVLENYIYDIIHYEKKQSIEEWIKTFNNTFKFWGFSKSEFKQIFKDDNFNRTTHVYITSSMFCAATCFFENLNLEFFINPLKMFGNDIKIEMRVLPYLTFIITDWQYLLLNVTNTEPKYGFFERQLSSFIQIESAISSFVQDVKDVNCVELIPSEKYIYDNNNMSTLNIEDLEETLIHYLVTFNLKPTLIPERYINTKDNLFRMIFKTTAKRRAEKLSFFTNDPKVCSEQGNPYIPIDRTNENNPGFEWFGLFKKNYLCKFSPENPTAKNLLSGWGFDVDLMLFDLKWFPCRSSVCDVMNEGYIPVLENNIGPDDSCFIGKQILGCKPLYASQPLSNLISEMKLKCIEYNILVEENKEKFKKLCIESGEQLLKIAATLI